MTVIYVQLPLFWTPEFGTRRLKGSAADSKSLLCPPLLWWTEWSWPNHVLSDDPKPTRTKFQRLVCLDETLRDSFIELGLQDKNIVVVLTYQEYTTKPRTRRTSFAFFVDALQTKWQPLWLYSKSETREDEWFLASSFSVPGINRHDIEFWTSRRRNG